MKKHLPFHLLFSLLLLCVSCNGQEKIKLSNDTQETESIECISPYGPTSITRTIKEDRNGNIWLATWEGIIRYDGKTFNNITRKLTKSRFFSILEDRQGDFWFGSIGSGVYYYDGVSFQNWTTADGLIHDSVTNIYEDATGHIWIGTLGGISRYDGVSFQNYTTADGMPHNDVNAIIEDADGLYWIATRGEACTYDGKAFSVLKNNENESFVNVRSIIKDQENIMWLGGNDGLWSSDGSSFSKLSDRFVGYIYEDSKGNIWTSSERKDSSAWVISSYDQASLSKGDAVATTLMLHGAMYFGILEDRDGNIWFGSLDGAYKYDGLTFDNFKKNGDPLDFLLPKF